MPGGNASVSELLSFRLASKSGLVETWHEMSLITGPGGGGQLTVYERGIAAGKSSESESDTQRGLSVRRRSK